LQVLIDLHVHTDYSDGFDLPLSDVIRKASDRGLNAIVLTECDLVPDVKEVQEIAAEAGFPVFVGAEIEFDNGRAIGIPADPTDKRFADCGWTNDDGLPSLGQVIDFFKELNGVVLAVHPFLDDGGPYLGHTVCDTTGLVAIEVLCGVSNHMANDRALEAAASMGLPAIGGSDSGPRGERLGQFATVFSQPVSNQAELVEALKSGDAWPVEMMRPRRNDGRDGRRGNNRG
jgi:hypothetical protein